MAVKSTDRSQTTLRLRDTGVGVVTSNLNSYRVEAHIARIPSKRCSTQPRLAVGVNQVRIPHAVTEIQ